MMNLKQMELFENSEYTSQKDTVSEAELAIWHSVNINPDVSQLAVLKCLAEFGEEGTTSHTISIETGLPISTVSPRLTQLKQFGLVDDTGRRIRTSKGRTAYFFKVSDFGNDILEKVSKMNELFTPQFDLIDFDAEPMTFDHYSASVMDKAIYPDTLLYPVLGLVSEAGEVADKVKKHFRDNEFEVYCEDAIHEIPAETRMEIAQELGDLMWYITAISADIGYELEEIAMLNIEKLESRQERGVLKGSGDNR